ncbi:hypothetical protein [Enterovibrio norvegicus]|uniref:hypothetical protein n=1 Tax=Enterovibrio norvegicus TaxID=188144 RepID=UPI00355341E8
MNRTVLLFGAAALAVGVMGYQGLMIKALKADVKVEQSIAQRITENRDELAAQLMDSETTKSQLITQIEHLGAVLASRDMALTQSHQELVELSDSIEGLRNHNDEFKTWSSARVPNAVIRLLRHARTPESDRENSD